MKIMQPFLMVILIDYASPTSTVTTFQAYLTVVALAVSTFIFLFSSSHLFFWNKVTALHIRAALSAMIYKKVCGKRFDKYSLDQTCREGGNWCLHCFQLVLPFLSLSTLFAVILSLS